MGTLTNSHPDKIPLDTAFHQGLSALFEYQFSDEEILNYFLEIITCDPSLYTMDHSDFIVCSLWKIPLVLKGLKYHPPAKFCSKSWRCSRTVLEHLELF